MVPKKPVKPTHNFDVPGYEVLANIMHRAYEQAALGKGKERHANDKPFHLQPIAIGAQHFGIGSTLFQMFKKAEECQRLPADAAVRELLGAMVYAAATIMEIERLVASSED